MELEKQFLDESQILSKIGSWYWDVTTNEVVWSKNMFRVLGLEPDEFKPSYELAFHYVHHSDKKRYEETLTDATQNKKEYFFENKITRKDNVVISVISRGNCILDENQNLIQMIGTVQDVSIQKELEKVTLDKKNAEERDKIKSLILGLIAHDINSPLNHIHSFSDLLIENIQNKEFENALEYVHIINNSTIQVRKVLDVLLEWALTDTETFNPELIRPKKLIESTIEYLNISINKKNILIINNIKDDVNIFADKNMFTSLIRNIVSNAIKYSHNKGVITLEIRKEINEILISITDTGTGIAPEILKNLFSTNKLSSAEGTNNEMGYGMGLQLCKTIVEKHNGKIWFETVIGHGTTCNFTLSQN